MAVIDKEKVVEIANSWNLFTDSKDHLNIALDNENNIYFENKNGILKNEGSGYTGICSLQQDLMLFEDLRDPIVINTVRLVNNVRMTIIDYCNEFKKELK